MHLGGESNYYLSNKSMNNKLNPTATFMLRNRFNAHALRPK